MKKIKDKFLVIYIFINLMYILIGSILKTYSKIELELFSYGYIVLLCINVMIILILFFKKKYIKNKIDIFLILIILFACISTIFAYNPKKALFGAYERYEGLFTILYYLTLLFITSFIKKEDKKYIVYAIIFIGFIQTIFGIFQKLNLFNVRTVFNEKKRWATGFVMNPNFLASLILICLGYTIGLYYKINDKVKQLFCLMIIYFFFIGLLLTNSLSCVLGLIVIMIIMLIFSFKNKYIKKYIILSLIFIATLLFVNNLKMTTIISDFIRTNNETTNIVKGDLNDNYGTGRMELWKKTIPIIPKYLLHGVGVDCFSNIINGNPIIRGKQHRFVFDKAHNEYLQILVTMGIFSLISYLCMHFIIIKEGIKNKEIYYILPVIGYLIQAQFNISVINVAPFFYISLGLLIDRNLVKKRKIVKEPSTIT